MQYGGNRQAILAVIGTVVLINLCLGADLANPADKRPLAPFNFQVGRGDWPQWGGTPGRNNTPDAVNIPTEWDINTGKNIKWSTSFDFKAFGSIVVANGKVYVGTSNSVGCVKGHSRKHDLCVLHCLRESDGEILWQLTSEKLRKDREDCYPLTGLCSTPIVEGNRLWFVTNRSEIVCLDTEGFRDGENDGPFTSERSDDPKGVWDQEHQADILWKFDMVKELGISQQNRANCAPTIWGDVLFLCTSVGIDQDPVATAAPNAASFLAMDKQTGKLLWTDSSVSNNLMHVQWSSPAVGVFGGVPQVVFPGGDGWLYSFLADRWSEGKPEFLWKFDGNPKDADYLPGRKSTRNGIVAVPVIHDGFVYLAMGDSPTRGDGPGHLWCVDPTKRGDVSSELIADQNGDAAPRQRVQATSSVPQIRRKTIPNPNSALVWHYDHHDQNGNGTFEFDETMHRTLGSPAIRNNVLFIADFAGIVHCLNSKTGKPYWTCDVLAACYATPLIVGERVYVTDEDGDVAIFTLSPDPSLSIKKAEPGRGIVHEPIHEIGMVNSIYTMPVVANNVLYIAANNELFAIAAGTNGSRRHHD